MLRRFIYVLGSALLAGCSVFGIRSGYEEPSYALIETLEGGLEVRRYGARLAAQTTVQGEDRKAAMNEAFGILAGYIFGEKRPSEKVAMTVPVEVQEASEDISMTAPVQTESTDSGLVMRFFMPARFTRETLPLPMDGRVQIVEIPGETLAVLRFSGLGRGEAVAQRETELLGAVADSKWRAEGTPIVYYYDPPWTLPFLRRNEVAVPVATPRATSEEGRVDALERGGSRVLHRGVR